MAPEPTASPVAEIDGGDAEEKADAVVPPPAFGRWTTRRWLQLGVSVALAVLAALGLLGVWALHHAGTVTDRLVDRESSMLIASIRFEAAMLDQETGIRGYGMTGRADFLQPYLEGKAQQQAALRVLNPLVEAPRERADLALVLRHATAWQDQVATPIAAAKGAAATRVADERAGAGKTDFDALRAAMAAQQQHLTQDRAAGRADLDTVRNERNAIFFGIAALILVIAGLVFTGLRRGVTTPLERLGTDTAQVAAGDFAHPIVPRGPADLRSVAASVEAMRRRLTAELAVSGRARDRLADQTGELRRSNAELEQFAYVASHDLQEPLRKVASFSQMLRRRYGDQLDERANQYIDFAIDGANRMQTLINDLLQFSRVGRFHESRADVDLEEVYTTTENTLSVAIEEAGAHVEHDPLPTVTGDPGQLALLLQNLLSNAIKFRSPDRTPEIRVSAARQGDMWQFAVADNGIGIGEEYAERVFVIFQRLHTRESYPGTGIGLAMCKKIVEFHGGTIGVDTTHTPGTKIAFTLPAEAEGV
ncbi:sensor histidine kinase [Actinomadura sp. DC4]|uniref:sensor histidine kinase n=1 Tax=Actinomadura sp. DC4 TaxID=3055069 RepID=UPI0025B13962|nr:sensor histidine kinase [Actinomadura sp. DC4]MDN3354842.1 ATP-binding protein [Actinomadura sp. DC4]